MRCRSRALSVDRARRHLLPRRGRDADRRQGEAEIRLPSQALGRLRKPVEQPNDGAYCRPGMLQGERSAPPYGRTPRLVDGLLGLVLSRSAREHLRSAGQRSLAVDRFDGARARMQFVARWSSSENRRYVPA